VRRTSSITDEDRENALKVRKNALKGNGGMFFHGTPLVCDDDAISSEIDLSDIARSSVAVSCSPTKENSIPSSIFVSRSAPRAQLVRRHLI
jgi:hypothetical protein